MVINTNARPKMMAMTTEIMLELALLDVWKNCIKDGTTRARIPEKIMSETPFPKPSCKYFTKPNQEHGSSCQD